MADESHNTRNTAERERLTALVARLTDDDLARSVGGGWTVATVLGHMAFWDRRSLYLIDQWEQGGTGPSHEDHEPHSVDWINESVATFLQAIPPRELAQLAVRLAEETDRRVAGLSPELIAANEAAGRPLNLLRASHRGEHLDQLEQALSV